ncbi:ANTAR domain-containing protein [Streptomyces actinomycinicus]|uniref:ANTAR domain-containing protein n=1 Tax=Streptomyces actinomycinicus TaxID=1695166 RepID=A0A937EK67_9ACTN|nr:ANTAR domain-containing protein [Streptomyces actinomycinicus]MBL1083570.1 ANTAR domain-containing protein [Streptomyces actinomycinicus]
MTPSPHPGPRSAPASIDELAAELEQVRAENRHLRRALASHAVVDQAIGVLLVLGRVSPCNGFSVLREVSQRTNTKLSVVAEQVLKHAQGAALPDVLLGELRAALARHADACRTG